MKPISCRSGNNPILCAGGPPGNRGLSFFVPEGRTYSPLAKAGGGSPPVGRARALSEGDCVSCVSRWTMPQPCGNFCHRPRRRSCDEMAKCHLTKLPPACANLPPEALPQIQGRNDLVPPLIAVRRFSRRTCWNWVRPIMGRTYTEEELLRFTVALRKGW